MHQHVTRGDGILESFLSKKRAAMANKLIPDSARKGRILDIGCGSYPFFLINTKFREKHGIDPFVKLSKSYGKITLKKQDLEEKPRTSYPDNYFDVVAMLAVFEHLQQKKLTAVLREIHRILKPGGRLILTTPCPWTDGLLKIMARTGLGSKEEIHEHESTYPHKAIRHYLEKAGFDGKKTVLGYFELWLNNWGYAVK